MATHFRILAREIPWTEGPGGLQSMGCKESSTDSATEQQLPTLGQSPTLERKTGLGEH